MVAVVGAVLAFAIGAFVIVRGNRPPVAWATLATSDVHSLAFDAGGPDRLYFGHHGGLLESRDGGRTWQPTPFSGSDAMSVRSGSDRTQIAGHEVYVESVDGGVSWQPVANDLPGLDLHAFAVDPGDADHAWTFAAGFGLYETTDAGRQWQLRQEGNWGYLTAYRDAGATVLVAVGQEGLVNSRDGGQTWESLAYPGAPLAGGLAAATDGSSLYTATSSGLRRSNDQGATWQDTGFGGVALAVAVNPQDPGDVAVIDEEKRFYRSADRGDTWPAP